jgi:glycine oxidase
VIERWAGVRPRGTGPNPLVGPVPGLPGVFVATGGYKIGFGLAHAVARSLLALLDGGPDGLPAAFRADRLADGRSGVRG